MEIEKFNPCREALVFRSQYSSFKEAWEACPRGDWMLWIAQKLEVDLMPMTKAKALCALTVRHLMKDPRSINACEVALRFADGLATRDELDNATDAADASAADAAYAAADAAAASAAAYAADASAADAAYAAAVAAAAYAAYAAAKADAYAASNAAKIDNQNKTADICREVLTKYVMEKK